MARRSGGKPRHGNAGASSLSQFGLFDMPDLSKLGEVGDDDGDEDDDDDLEAELSALMSGKTPVKQKKAPKQAMDLNSIQRMAASAMKDIPDEDDDEDEGNLSDDAELLAELQGLSPNAGNHSGRLYSGGAEGIAPAFASRANDDLTPFVNANHRRGSSDLAPPVPAHQAKSPSPASTPAGHGTSLLDTLTDRLENYRLAEAAAKTIGDNSKARRYNRGFKTLQDQMKLAKAGGQISEDDIPPPVAIPKADHFSAVPKLPRYEETKPPDAVQSNKNETTVVFPPKEHLIPLEPPINLRPSAQATVSEEGVLPKPFRPAPPVPQKPSSGDTQQVGSTQSVLIARRDQYKVAALRAKKAGDVKTAVEYVKTSKQFDAVLEALNQGRPVDLSKMPPPPPVFHGASVQKSAPTNPPGALSRPQSVTPVPAAPHKPPTESSAVRVPAFVDENVEEDPELFNAPPPPTSIVEALQQRLEKYQSTLESCKQEGNNSKVRRMGRIVKQYQDAIKLHKAGKPVDFEELPTPPGFGPIPVPDQTKPQGPSSVPQKQEAPKPGAVTQPTGANVPPPVPARKPPIKRAQSTVLDKQMQFLLERQKLFREAALDAKKRGDTQQAKEYLRMMKGIDPMIQATQAGLPINASSIPIPPQLQEDFVVVDPSECFSGGNTDLDEGYRKLERELIQQHELSVQNKDHFFKLGDVSSATKFEKLAQEAHHDLEAIQNMWKRGDPLPKFHYETRIFSIVKSNPDLGDNDLELSVVRAVNLPGKPDDLDSYIKVIFPYPNDNPQLCKTKTVKDTNIPEYNETFKFEIKRTARSFARIIKKHPIKLEVWCKKGLFRSDALLGTALVKFQDLETKSMIHDSFDVLDNKKPCGGKVEVKLRVREPFVSKQVEEIKQRWLLIGS